MYHRIYPFPLCRYERLELQACMVNLFNAFLGNTNLFSNIIVILHSHQPCVSASFCTSLAKFAPVCLFYIPTLVSEKWCLIVVFIHIFLMSKEWCWESFHVLIFLLIVSLDKCVFKSFVHFWIGLLAYFNSLSPPGGKHYLKF